MTPKNKEEKAWMRYWVGQCHFGDCLETLKHMPNNAINTCVTSTPYFGLRSYGGGSAEIGREKTPEEFITSLVTVFREVKRVLKKDGTLWLNIGDCYDVKKQLLGIPWRVALALQADGWILRQEIIWQKSNPMPESVTDRCTKSHEHIFLLAKSPRYYCNMNAIKEPSKSNDVNGFRKPYKSGPNAMRGQGQGQGNQSRANRDGRDMSVINQSGMVNKRTVWTVSTRPYYAAHFAVFPPALIEPCIIAGAPAGGIVLDPFGGSGTTAQVAEALGRQWILIELNREYEPLQANRLRQKCLALDC